MPFSSPSFFTRIEKKSTKAILLLGPPCAGKSTQLERIAALHPGVMCVSTGNLVRQLDEKRKNPQITLNSIELKAAESLDKMRRGELMDDEAVYALLMDYFSPDGEGYANGLQADLIILDGVIKAHHNILPFENALHKFNAQSKFKLSLEKVINLQVQEQELISRFQMRVLETVQKGNGARADDNLDIYRKRLHNYMTENEKILAYYHENLAVIHVDGAQNKELTTQKLLEEMELQPGIFPTLK